MARTTFIASPFSKAEEALLVLLSSQWRSLQDGDPKALEQAQEALGLDIEVGTLVRSFDHAGDFGCYVEGTVVEILSKPSQWAEWGCPRYAIRPTRSVRDGRSRECSAETVYPPVNGTPCSMGGRTLQVFRASAFAR